MASFSLGGVAVFAASFRVVKNKIKKLADNIVSVIQPFEIVLVIIYVLLLLLLSV